MTLGNMRELGVQRRLLVSGAATREEDFTCVHLF
jgi:hypothetical protein